MNKKIIIASIFIVIVGVFFVVNSVYAAERKAIDAETESKIVELKENAANSLEDYKVKYRFRYIWNSSLYFKYSTYL